MHKKRNFLVWTLMVLIVSCWSCSGPNARGRKHKKKQPITKAVQPCVVLLHGLDRQADVFDTMAQALQHESWDVLKITTSRTEGDGIEQQAKEAYNLFQTKSIDKTRLVCVVGHSQGGLRAYLLAQHLQKKGYASVIVVTIGTPWLGVTAMDDFSVAEKVLKAQNRDPILGSIIKPAISAGVERYMYSQDPGVKDMDPNSALIQKIHTSLPQNSIPILAIAGEGGSVVDNLLQKFGDKNTTVSLKKGTRSEQYPLKYVLSCIFSGSPLGKIPERDDALEQHDMLITVRSQRAEGLPAQQFERDTVTGALHDLPPEFAQQLSQDRLVTQFIDVDALKKATELEHPAVIQKVIAYIKGKL